MCLAQTKLIVTAMASFTVIASLSLLACGGSEIAHGPPPNLTTPPETTSAFECDEAPTEKSKWNHRFGSRATTKLGSARHGTADAFTVAGSPAAVMARFQYSKTLKDLEDEPVALWLADVRCGWRRVATAMTNNDGVASFALEDAAVAAAGVFAFEVVVGGDESRARGYLWVLKPDTPIVVFDIDGTLTTGDDELVEQLLLGATPDEAPGASDVVRHYAERGAQPIYLTGRPVVLEGKSRRWLETLGYPRGPLGLTQGYRRGVFRVEEFKTAQLVRIKNTLGLDIVAAYGNAKSDVCAYSNAGIDPSRTFIIGKHAGSGCKGGPATVPITDYRDHLTTLQ